MTVIDQLTREVADATHALSLRRAEYEAQRVVLERAFEEVMRCSTSLMAAQTALIREHTKRLDEDARASGRTLDDLVASGDISPAHAEAIRRLREEEPS